MSRLVSLLIRRVLAGMVGFEPTVISCSAVQPDMALPINFIKSNYLTVKRSVDQCSQVQGILVYRSVYTYTAPAQDGAYAHDTI